MELQQALTFERQKRFEELAATSKASIFGQVFALQKPDYAKDVTEASQKAFVLVLMMSSLGTNVESRLAIEIWHQLASKFGDLKFCEIRADLCVEGYPERNTPTVLVYKGGEIQKQLVTLKELNGPKTTPRGRSVMPQQSANAIVLTKARLREATGSSRSVEG